VSADLKTMTARCMSCGDGIEIGNALALMLERADIELVLHREPGRRWATELIGVCVNPHRCDKPTIGAVDRQLNERR
jgi:hypothetical protein